MNLEKYLYYDRAGIQIYLGDCREILPQNGSVETVITDPTWPDADVKINGQENPYQMFAQMCQVIPAGTERLVVQLGCDSDPRFLQGIPAKWPFLRVCWLDYARPSYKLKRLNTVCNRNYQRYFPSSGIRSKNNATNILSEAH